MTLQGLMLIVLKSNSMTCKPDIGLIQLQKPWKISSVLACAGSETNHSENDTCHHNHVFQLLSLLAVQMCTLDVHN